MGRILPKETIDKIASTNVDALPDIWNAAMQSPDQGAVQALRQEWSERASGSSAAVVQQLGVLLDEGIGWAPWQRDALVSLAALPTDQLVSGRAIAEKLIGLATDLAKTAWNKFRKEIEKAVMDLLDPIIGLITSIPVVGQIVELVLGFVFAIVDLIKMHNSAAEASAKDAAESDRVAPASPSPLIDKAILEQYVKKTANTAGDWSPVFMPYKDFRDDYLASESLGGKGGLAQGKYEKFWLAAQGGWVCPQIKKENSSQFAGGVRIIPAGERSWGVQATSFNYGLGLGLVPGTGNIHRDIQASGRTGQLPVDTGQWLTMSRNGAMFLWSLLDSDGPSSLAVDPDLVAEAWSRYINAFLEGLDEGRICRKGWPWYHPGISDSTRAAVRRNFIKTIGFQSENPDLPGYAKNLADVDIQTASLKFPGMFAMGRLKARQQAVLKSTAVAYVNPSKAPAKLRDKIIAARKSLLESPLVCRVDPTLIPDQTYKSAVEGKLMQLGVKCDAAMGLKAPLGGGEMFDERAKPPRALPLVSVPRVPVAGRVSSAVLTGNLKPVTASKTKEPFINKYGAAIGIAIAVAAGGGYAFHQRKNERK
jgi:hypothetical protein